MTDKWYYSIWVLFICTLVLLAFRPVSNRGGNVNPHPTYPSTSNPSVAKTLG